MIDMHHDTLSILYYCYLRNDFTYINKITNYYNKHNVKGVIANLYFMNNKEMKAELGEFYQEDINVVEMFKISTNLFKKNFPDTQAIFSIEGCDYIKDTNELEELYNLGLRNILLVWNNPNKYGSGIRSDQGLSKLGKEFLIKAIDLGISIDLSHMNKKTFYDTIELLKQQKKLGKNIKVIVSHSNCYKIRQHQRNLDDEQIKILKEFNPVIGIVSYKKFIFDSKDKEVIKNKYLEHINNIIDLLDINSIGISTDDMMYSNYLFNKNYEKLFDYETIKKDLTTLLSKNYNQEEINKILSQNIYNKLFSTKYQKD